MAPPPPRRCRPPCLHPHPHHQTPNPRSVRRLALIKERAAVKEYDRQNSFNLGTGARSPLPAGRDGLSSSAGGCGGLGFAQLAACLHAGRDGLSSSTGGCGVLGCVWGCNWHCLSPVPLPPSRGMAQHPAPPQTAPSPPPPIFRPDHAGTPVPGPPRSPRPPLTPSGPGQGPAAPPASSAPAPAQQLAPGAATAAAGAVAAVGDRSASPYPKRSSCTSPNIDQFRCAIVSPPLGCQCALVGGHGG